MCFFDSVLRARSSVKNLKVQGITLDKIIERVGDERLVSFNNYILVSPSKHILSGFFVESLPRGSRLWQFRLPLFDTRGFIHLAYSDLLFNEQLIPNTTPIFIDTISSAIKKNLKSATRNNEIDAFIRYCKKKRLTNFDAFYSQNYAFALVVSGKYSQALKVLNKLDTGALNISLEDINCICEGLRSNNYSQALDKIIAFESQFLEKHGFDGIRHIAT